LIENNKKILKKRNSGTQGQKNFLSGNSKRESVCVCVCVCKRERGKKTGCFRTNVECDKLTEEVKKLHSGVNPIKEF